MTQTTRPSVIPIYLVGVTWLVHSLVFPLYSIPHIICCALESFIVYMAARALCPDRKVETDSADYTQTAAAGAQTAAGAAQTQTAQEASGGPDPAVQSLLKERDRALSEMRRLNDSIEDPKISAQIDHLESVTGKILSLVAEQPQKQPQIRRFLNYYLPTTLKILNAYDRMGSAGIQGSNIDATKQKVEKMMDTIVVAFDHQLDALFHDDAMDISSDITVMENLLAQEGLSQPDSGADDPIQLQF